MDLLYNYFSSLDAVDVSTVNTNLIKFVGDQRLHKNIKWIMSFWRSLAIICLQERSCCSAFPYMLLILLGAAIPVTLTKNYIKAIYLNSSGKRFLPLKLPARKIYLQNLAYKKSLARKKSCLPDWFRYFQCLLKKRSRL